MVVAPGMVGTAAGRGLQGAREVGQRECHDVVRVADLRQGIVEAVDGTGEVRKQRRLAVELVVVRVELVQCDEEYLL
jgi:hypothetical protein